MMTRALTGRVIRPDGAGITTGAVVATPLLPVPADAANGVLAPTRQVYPITAGELSGQIVAPCAYMFEIYDGDALVWRFQRAVAAVASPTTLQAIYTESAALPSIPPDVLVEGDPLTLLSAGSAPAGTVPTSDGAGGIAWTAAGAGDMTRTVYDTDADGIVDAAATVPWAGVTGTPAFYPPAAHTHAADDVTAGQIAAARGGTGTDSSGWSGVPLVTAGVWSAGASAADVAAIPRDAGIVTVSASHTLAAGDAGKIIECTGTLTVTAPDGLPTGYQCVIVNVGTGSVTLAAATTLQTKGNKTALSSQYGAATMYHRGSNVWLAVGDLS